MNVATRYVMCSPIQPTAMQNITPQSLTCIIVFSSASFLSAWLPGAAEYMPPINVHTVSEFML